MQSFCSSPPATGPLWSARKRMPAIPARRIVTQTTPEQLDLDAAQANGLILAVEQSSTAASIALMQDGTVVAGREWRARTDGSLFDAVPEILADRAELDDIGVFAVGLGPGSFAGLRTAVAAAQGYALPDHRSVFGVSSGDALALGVARDAKQSRITVVGNARRGLLWHAPFESANGDIRRLADWQLSAPAAFAADLPADTLVVGPDWDQLAEVLQSTLDPSIARVEEPRAPAAADVARLAYDRIRKGVRSEPLVPIYLHPAVFVAPRFPGAAGSPPA
jgi:tRNA threonylcarbamoyladenosine biosynthesis protein TsaB